MTPNPPPDKDVDIELLRAYIKSKAPESEFNALWEPILSRLTTRTDTLQRENEEALIALGYLKGVLGELTTDSPLDKAITAITKGLSSNRAV